WMVVILLWFALPFLAGNRSLAVMCGFIPTLLRPWSFFCGIAAILAGYAGTLWCYSAMGNTWRIGVNKLEKTTLVRRGPYQYVRHPIYAFQFWMLAGSALLLPVMSSFIMLALHVICVLAKAADEESYLGRTHDIEYLEYRSRTGRFFPKLFPRRT